MKSITALLALTLLLAEASNRCYAVMEEVVVVSKERAKELGMEIRFTGNAPNEVWVELEFRTEGNLKDFRCVTLEIREGEKFLVGYAPLQEKRSRSGSVVVRFLANRAYLDKVRLRVVAGQPMDLTGYELRMKEFVAPGKAR